MGEAKRRGSFRDRQVIGIVKQNKIAEDNRKRLDDIRNNTKFSKSGMMAAMLMVSVGL